MAKASTEKAEQTALHMLIEKINEILFSASYSPRMQSCYRTRYY